MSEASVSGSKPTNVEDARDLLIRLYGEVRISALAAALEMARCPAPEDIREEPARDMPAILRDQDIAA